jgi:hypothetical protein
VKSRKDVVQAALVLSCLLDQRPGDIWLAIDAAIVRGGKFLALLEAGLARLEPSALRDALVGYVQDNAR